MTELEQEAIEFMKKHPKDPEGHLVYKVMADFTAHKLKQLTAAPVTQVSQHAETDLERQLAICEQNGTKWAEPPVIKPPFQKSLTVIMLRDESDQQAEKDLQAIADNKSTVIRIGVPELYFHHLRLRVAQDPSLADKIAVFYVMPDKEMREVELKSGQQIKWPVGFGDEIWNKEKEVQKVKMREVGLKFDDELK